MFSYTVAQVDPVGTQENVPEQAICSLVPEGPVTGPCVPAGWAGRHRCPGHVAPGSVGTGPWAGSMVGRDSVEVVAVWCKWACSQHRVMWV